MRDNQIGNVNTRFADPVNSSPQASTPLSRDIGRITAMSDQLIYVEKQLYTITYELGLPATPSEITTTDADNVNLNNVVTILEKRINTIIKILDTINGK